MRLIDADALEVFVKTVRQGLYLDKTLSDIPTRDSMLLNFQQYVHLQPTIDAVPVVHCGECEKQFMPDCPLQIIEKHERRFICQKDDDFCSYGEKTEDKLCQDRT